MLRRDASSYRTGNRTQVLTMFGASLSWSEAIPPAAGVPQFPGCDAALRVLPPPGIVKGQPVARDELGVLYTWEPYVRRIEARTVLVSVGEVLDPPQPTTVYPPQFPAIRVTIPPSPTPQLIGLGFVGAAVMDWRTFREATEVNGSVVEPQPNSAGGREATRSIAREGGDFASAEASQPAFQWVWQLEQAQGNFDPTPPGPPGPPAPSPAETWYVNGSATQKSTGTFGGNLPGDGFFLPRSFGAGALNSECVDNWGVLLFWSQFFQPPPPGVEPPQPPQVIAGQWNVETEWRLRGI